MELTERFLDPFWTFPGIHFVLPLKLLDLLKC